MPPLIACSSLRIDVAGVPAIDGLSFESTGDWVLVLGSPRALFEGVAGLRPVERGETRVGGLPPLQGIRAGVVSAAPLDPPLPLRWSPLQYVTWSARLAGQPRRVAASAAADVIERFALGPFAREKLGRISLAARRATVLAAANVTGATALIVEDPGVGMPPEVAGPFARIVVRALAGRRAIWFASRVALESPLGLAADEAIVLDGSRVAIQGAPAQIASNAHAYCLRVAGDVHAFATAMASAGARLLAPSDTSMPTHMSLNLGPLATSDVLRIALECSAIILELRPLAGSFA